MEKRCEILGKLLKSADDLQLFYYENKNMISNCPEVLVGSNFVELVSRNPMQGIERIKKRTFPFLKSVIRIISKNPNEEIQAKKVVKDFNSCLEDAVKICSEEKGRLTNEEKTNVVFNYLKY